VLRWANAGHPPPLLLRADRTVTLLGGAGPDLMLGVDPGAERAEASVELAPGDTVVLYTDGLVERRGRSLDDGSALLCAAVAELSGRPPEQLCDEVLERMLRGRPQDDVAVAVVTWRPDPDADRDQPDERVR
jgi:serine phosphatase RsbU (regulator of sigma subunit)